LLTTLGIMMNNRIKQLEMECYEDRSNGYSAPYFNREKFAELIVRECMSVGFNAAYPNRGVDVLLAIKEHFGVE